MIEKVNPEHPDKLCDRIAGAIVDLAYKYEENPKIAVEVLLGHDYCFIIIETSVPEYFLSYPKIEGIVHRIAGDIPYIQIHTFSQDINLARNQKNTVRCGDNGIFKGIPLTNEEVELSLFARDLFADYPTDGKYIMDGDRLIICQSQAQTEDIKRIAPQAEINPLGYWRGGPGTDTGATNRKLGSDMGHAVTGGGLHGKDLSKADVSVNIYAFLKAQESGEPVELCCAIGDTEIDGVPYSQMVEAAREFIREKGGFEKFAEWGLF